MKSFVFWLATAAALGALFGSTLRLGFPEIVILWLAVIAAHYGWKSLSTKRRDTSSVASN